MTLKFKIKTPKRVKKLAFDFNIKRIIRDFHFIEEPEERCRFIRRKLEEISTADSSRRKMNLLAKMKLAYLLDFRHLDLILSGFLGEANVDLEILTKVQSQQ